MYWVMLNPSTADGASDDATIRRCIGFAMNHGYGGIVVSNLFAVRETDPSKIRLHLDPVGGLNNGWLASIPEDAFVVAAWGSSVPAAYKQTLKRRVEEVRKIIKARPVYCLGRCSDGSPRHPVRLAYTTEMEVYWE
jgi:hypothetical protein